MPTQVAQRSQRFLNAAKTERDRLARKRAQMSKKREDLQARIDLLDKELEAVSDEISALESLATLPGSDGEIALLGSEEKLGPCLLKGAAIRNLAVPLLLRTQGETPIHYRDWLGLLRQEGYAVAGKRHDAVFLNQVVRSPLVKATTRAGYYVADLGAVERLREDLERHQAELGGLMLQLQPHHGQSSNRHRDQQRELSTAVARIERELDEATAAVEAWKAAGNLEDVEARAA